jgi:REP element-mobilizing transposase RayT
MAVFGVKYRLGLISKRWREELYAVIGQTLKSMDGVTPIIVGGASDHVHVLFSTKGNVSESEIIRRIKSDSSRWVNENRLSLGRFAWQEGGSRISYSHSALPNVTKYIANQEEHHRHVSFREEYEKWLQEIGANYTTYDLPENLK